jgi:hypothetical protein
MKANEAKVIKLEAELVRSDRVRHQQELEGQRKKLAAQARLAHKKNLTKFDREFLSLEADVLSIKKSIAEALTDDKDFITFKKTFLSSISQHIKSINELGTLVGKKQILLPPVLSSFTSHKGYGILNPKELTNKHSKDIKKIQLEIVNFNEDGFRNSLRAIVYEALDQYDPENNQTINSIDESIILDFQKKISNGNDLEDGELTFVVSILKGKLESFYRHQKKERIQASKQRESLQTQFKSLQDKFNFFNELSTLDDYVLCWGTDVWWAKLFENSPYIQVPLINATFRRINSASHDILENVALLNWAADLVIEGFYDECFAFISQSAEEGFDSCLVKVTEIGLTLSQGRKRKVIAFENSIPISKQSAIFQYWEDFFNLLEYKTDIIETSISFKICWD